MIKDGWRDWARAAVFENFGLKLISLICALGFYAFIHGAENAQRTLAVSVVSIMPAENANRQLMTQLPNEVAVTVRGSRTQLDDLRADDLGSLQLDLRSARETRIDIDASMFHVPAGLRVEQIYPASITLRWDDLVSRQIPVQVARTGEPAAGFSVRGGTAVEPTVVTAHGPRSTVDVMQFARSAPFDISGLSEGTYRRPLPLDKPPHLVNYDVETVTATVEVTRALVTKEFSGLKVEVVGLPRATTVPKEVRVVVTGPAEVLTQLAADTIVPHVDIKGAGVDVSVPGSVRLDVVAEVQQAKVEVRPDKVLVKW